MWRQFGVVVSTGMGVWEIYICMLTASQVNSAWPSPSVSAMSTSQRAVMLYSLQVKEGMARDWWQVKLLFFVKKRAIPELLSRCQ